MLRFQGLDNFKFAEFKTGALGNNTGTLSSNAIFDCLLEYSGVNAHVLRVEPTQKQTVAIALQTAANIASRATRKLQN